MWNGREMICRTSKPLFNSSKALLVYLLTFKSLFIQVCVSLVSQYLVHVCTIQCLLTIIFCGTDSIAELYKAYPFVCCSSSESESSPDLERYESWPTRILPHLFLGDYSSATAAPVLRRWGITHIINVTHEPNYFQCNNTSPRTSSSYPSSPLATHSSVARSSASSNSSSRQDAPGASKDSFQYLRIAVSDSSKQSIAEYFETAISFIG
ncbi:Dual specificity protein phosphatase 6, variant 4 [Balamuthia mandrillaris]